MRRGWNWYQLWSGGHDLSLIFLLDWWQGGFWGFWAAIQKRESDHVAVAFRRWATGRQCDVIQPNLSTQHLPNCFASASHLFLYTRLTNNCVISFLCDCSRDTVESIRILAKRIGLSRPKQAHSSERSLEACQHCFSDSFLSLFMHYII